MSGSTPLDVLLASRKVMAVCNTLVVVSLENSHLLPPRYGELVNYVEAFIRKQSLETEFKITEEN